jgi:signal transduction histidine kinase
VQPDLILSANAFPDMCGLDVLRRLKSAEETRLIPVIMVTADEREQTLVAAFKCGATDYVAKPVREFVLRARVRRALEESLLMRKLEQSRQAAIEATRSKSAFLANMSHEIRTPMTAILGFAEILADNDLSPECVEAAQTIKRNGQYLLELINDILDLSKIEANRLETETTVCSPIQIVEDVIALMRFRAESKGLQLTATCRGPIPARIQSDPTRLRQILINLIGNAVKFTEVGSVQLITHLETDAAEPKLRFDVVDSGIGMTDAQRRRLFQPFTQADASTTRRFSGTGLGLTISKRLADALGGEIYVKSSPGKGSTFTVTVATGGLDDVANMEEITPVTTAEAPTNADEPAANRGRVSCRVLLAEDGPDNQRLLSFILSKAGADVTIVENGQAAVDAVLNAMATSAGNDCREFDLVLMDMQMPVMDGYDATRRLRRQGFTGPIVALTAHASEEDRQRCLHAGCDDFVSKPVNRNALVDLLHAYGDNLAAAGSR